MPTKSTDATTTAPPEPTTNFPTLLTIAQVATILQVTTRTIHRWIDAGDLVTHRFGRGYRISEVDLQAFIRLRRQG